MDASVEVGKLLSPEFHGGGRGVCFLIPVEIGGGGGEEGNFAEKVLHGRSLAKGGGLNSVKVRVIAG